MLAKKQEVKAGKWENNGLSLEFPSCGD